MAAIVRPTALRPHRAHPLTSTPEHCAAPGARPTIDRRMDQSALAQPAALLEREHEVERVRAALRAVGQRAGGALVDRGRRGDGEVAAARGGTRTGVGPRRSRPQRAGDGARAGVPVRGRAPAVRAPAAGGRHRRARPLAGGSRGAGGGGAHRSAGVGLQRAGAGPSAGDPGYAWQHGLYWLASNLSADSPLVLVVDDLQWCDAPSARALAFIARRLEGQPLALILATRPLDPALTPEAATLVADPAAELLRPAPLTRGGGRRTGRRPAVRASPTIGSSAPASR